MDYWRGFMDWPLDADWVCETCGTFAGLTWGMPHAVCRCDTCHTQYIMRDGDKPNRPTVTRPISLLKEEYKSPAKAGWALFGTPITKWDDAEWDKAFEAAK